MNKDEYDITTYSDQECFDILNINNPSDRELEMKILQHMDNYENKSKRLYRFFESMYDRFFSEEVEDEDDVVEGMQNQDVTNQVATTSTTATAATTATTATANNQVATTTTNPFTGLASGTTIINTIDTHNVDYVKDPLKLNPVERKTIFKMISIDSQFREDPGNTSATNFTMNLSESIDNVISTKLYSVQIPYTWYTINATFGSNFFYIKGNSPGINNGDHDIKVDIPSGTYTAPEIVAAINAKFDFLKNVKDNELYNSVLDLSLGETKISYNKDANNAKVVLELDLKKKYNETDYQLYFPYWTDPNDTNNRSLSIPSFLGFNYDTYYPYIAYSNMTVPRTDNSISEFNINSTNNYFTIYQYTGTNAFDITTSTVINEIRITFSLAYSAYNRTLLEKDISNQLALNPLLDQTMSRFERIQNTRVGSSLNDHYEIAIKLNRNKIIQTDNSKLAIVFPSETSEGINHIWTGNDSCFIFKNDINELNEVVSETPAVITNYIIEPSSAIIKIECIKPNYDVSENTRIATVAPSTGAGYLLSQYIDAINNAIVTMNNQTILDNVNRPSGEFNITTGPDPDGYKTNLLIVSDKAKFSFDILREFTQKTYIVDLSGCFLSKDPIFFAQSYNNLTDSSFSFITDFSGAASYPINNSNNKLVLIPKKTGGPNNLGYGNQNSPNIELYFTNLTYTNIQDFINGINSNFINFVDSDNYNITKGCSITRVGNKLTLQLKVSKILNETNYKVTFIDNTFINGIYKNSWNEYLKIDSSFNLSGFDLSNNIVPDSTIDSAHSEIFAKSTIFTNTIQLTTLKNKFIFKPYTNGVADSNGANDIIIEIPAATATTYTRDGLINVIQALFTQNPLTNGSTISLVIDGNNQYTKLRININKTFYSEDFKLVLYDSVSFVYCNVGVAQNATWDSTLGWLLGFQKLPEYPLSELINSESAVASESNYLSNIYDFPSSGSGTGYTNSYNSTNRKIAIIGDVVLNTNLYNYFLIVLDDFIQNHVNAGLITITSLEADVALPTYASRASYQCDPVTGIKTAVSATNKLNTNLSSKQLYAMNQIIDAKRTKLKSYASGPYLKDVFALIPMKLSGMLFGQTYMEFGGTMQNQDRKYYGPVRIQKLSVKLMNDKGQQVNLNGANFSICIICEILNTKS